MNKGLLSMITNFITNAWYGNDQNGTGATPKPTAERLQEAVAGKMTLAETKGNAATAQMVAAKAARGELAKLVVQYDELKKQAILTERGGGSDKAKRILALALSVKEKVELATERFEKANQVATQLVNEARASYKEAKESAEDLPRKVMQLEVNRLAENAKQLESETRLQLEGTPSYEALSASIDVKTEQLLIRNIIDQESGTMDAEIETVLREADFQEQYKLLQDEARANGDDVIEGQFTEVDPANKARQLLADDRIGGIHDVSDSFTARREPVEVAGTDTLNEETGSEKVVSDNTDAEQ